MKKAFTISELLIVIAVIGILAAVLLPAAFHAKPNEQILKFKKANSTLGTVIRELVASPKYYADGDLGKKADGTLLDETKDADKAYLCNSMADLMMVKENKCSSITSAATTEATGAAGAYIKTCGTVTDSNCTTNRNLAVLKGYLDEACKNYSSGTQFITTDGVEWFIAGPSITFGHKVSSNRMFTSPSEAPAIGDYKDEAGFDGMYKVVCFDVDGSTGSIDPFGYGVRADGKILSGANADKYIEKSAVEKE